MANQHQTRIICDRIGCTKTLSSPEYLLCDEHIGTLECLFTVGGNCYSSEIKCYPCYLKVLVNDASFNQYCIDYLSD